MNIALRVAQLKCVESAQQCGFAQLLKSTVYIKNFFESRRLDHGKPRKHRVYAVFSFANNPLNNPLLIFLI